MLRAQIPVSRVLCSLPYMLAHEKERKRNKTKPHLVLLGWGYGPVISEFEREWEEDGVQNLAT